MNFIDRLLSHFERRGNGLRVITENEVIENSKPLSSAIVSLSHYVPKTEITDDPKSEAMNL